MFRGLFPARSVHWPKDETAVTDVKITKKDIQDAKAPDAVLTGATSAYDWIVEHKNALLGAIAVLVLAVGGASLLRANSREKEEALGAKLSTALQLENRPVLETAPEGSTEKTFKSKDEKQKAVTEAFEAVRKEAPGSDAAQVAGLHLAKAEMEAGKPADAAAKYEEYLAAVKSGGLRLFALENLGYALEAKGDDAKAAEAFARLGDEGAPGRALFHKARLAEKAGKKDEARKLYEQVTTDYSKEVVAGDARTRLELLDLPAPGVGGFEPAAPEAPKPPKGKRAGK